MRRRRGDFMTDEDEVDLCPDEAIDPKAVVVVAKVIKNAHEHDFRVTHVELEAPDNIFEAFDAELEAKRDFTAPWVEDNTEVTARLSDVDTDLTDDLVVARDATPLRDVSDVVLGAGNPDGVFTEHFFVEFSLSEPEDGGDTDA